MRRLFTRLRKRASRKRTPDAVSSPPPPPLSMSMPNVPISGPGSTHLDAPQQQIDGAVEGAVEHSVAVTAAAETTKSSKSIVAERVRVTTLEALPAELRCHILSHVADDLGSLRALTVASPVFYQQYLLDRKALLRAGLKTALGSSLVDAYAVQMSASLYDEPADDSSPKVPVQLETITLLIDNYVVLRSATPDMILAECCTEEDLLGMAAFYDSLVRPLISREFPTRFFKRLDDSLGVVDDLSATELARLSRAVYRYQFYCNLFGQGPDGFYRKVPELEHGHHLDVFFCMFKPWEIEELCCIYTLLKDSYSDILDSIKWDLDIEHPRFHYWPNPLAPGSWDLACPFIRESAIGGISMRGLPPFDDVIGVDDHEELVSDMQYYLVHGSNALDPENDLSCTNQYFRRERHPLEGDELEARRARLPFSGDTEDGPPLAWVIHWRGRYSNSYGDVIQPSLQSWGHVFWDRGRLIRSKGTEEVLRERERYRRF